MIQLLIIKIYQRLLQKNGLNVKGDITVTKKTFTADDIDAPNNTAANATATNNANNNAFGEKKLVFKNNAPFINCI